MSFVGAGPGAADLITLRGASRIAEADLVLYAPSITDATWLREHTRADAELVDLGRVEPDELLELYRRLASRRHKAVRLVAGDPALSPELREQRETCARLGLDVEVVPGVSPVSAAAAATGNGLVEAGGPDTLVVTGTDADFERVREVAAESRTIAVQAPAARAAELVEALTAAGLDPEVPVVVAHKVTWPDETVLRTTLGELVAEVKRANLWRHALFLVGDALRQAKPRAGYAPRDPEQAAAQRWTSRSWRSSGGEGRRPWARRAAEPEPDDSEDTDAAGIEDAAETEAAEAVSADTGEQARPAAEPVAEAKQPAKRAPAKPAAKKHPARASRGAAARRTTKKA
ncbi:cobalt-precorrin-4/precorrin-4 C(11)-methyltransferase [Actinokineospora iranica]|uniref:cobalt-precorrin-4/precorrin-4 C(11)-methyltransferase n=1 Tax=Actinokineospora iranica TaxID=1271860 RepID=UPI001587D9AF|nr:cobalt-precorrin-4/precorrin-4 C(11)-methyltransferase [Actinokineospora iranica]